MRAPPFGSRKAARLSESNPTPHPPRQVFLSPGPLSYPPIHTPPRKSEPLCRAGVAVIQYFCAITEKDKWPVSLLGCNLKAVCLVVITGNGLPL